MSSLLVSSLCRRHGTIKRLHDGCEIWTRGITLIKEIMSSGWCSPVPTSHNRDGLTSGAEILAFCCLRLLLLWKRASPVLEWKLYESRDFCLFSSLAFRKASDTFRSFFVCVLPQLNKCPLFIDTFLSCILTGYNPVVLAWGLSSLSGTFASLFANFWK